MAEVGGDDNYRRKKEDDHHSQLLALYANLIATRQATHMDGPIFPAAALPYTRPIDNTWHIINRLLATICVTHPHMDHISGLVLSSSNFSLPGECVLDCPTVLESPLNEECWTTNGKPGSTETNNSSADPKSIIASEENGDQADVDNGDNFLSNCDIGSKQCNEGSNQCPTPSIPKTVAGLKSTMDALVNYVFNGVVWPNLTNEGVDPVNLFSVKRLASCPDAATAIATPGALLATNLTVHAFPVSHGTFCMSSTALASRRRSSVARLSVSATRRNPGRRAASVFVPRNGYWSFPPSNGATTQQKGSLSCATSSNGPVSPSMPSPLTSLPSPSTTAPPSLQTPPSTSQTSYTSTAYFITDLTTSRQLLIWGDVEPDSVSQSPRNRAVWTRAAQLHAAQLLAGILIECSYPRDSGPLFGHMAADHLVRELANLADLVDDSEKGNGDDGQKRLQGLTVVVIHVKDEDPLQLVHRPLKRQRQTDELCEKVDPENVTCSQLILSQLEESAKAAGLGCTFRIATPGLSLYL